MHKCFLIFILTFVVRIHTLQKSSMMMASTMMDMSTSCIENIETSFFLPLGMGVADSITIIISDADVYPNCIITFNTAGPANGVYLIIVIEFPDRTEGPNNACQDEASEVHLKDISSITTINVCRAVNEKYFEPNETPMYGTIIKSSNASVKIASGGLFETVKITATASRVLKGRHDMCSKGYEYTCVMDDIPVCISNELRCDMNTNCGSSRGADEDTKVCDVKRYEKLWMVVVLGIIMSLVLAFFLIYLLRACIPRVPDNFFIFNEDEDNKLILASEYRQAAKMIVQEREVQPPKASSSSYKFVEVPAPADRGLLHVRHRQDEPPVIESEPSLFRIQSLAADQGRDSDEEEVRSISYEKEPEQPQVRPMVKRISHEIRKPRFQSEVTQIQKSASAVTWEDAELEAKTRETKTSEGKREKIKQKHRDSLTQQRKGK